jgi:hypothetical protein
VYNSANFVGPSKGELHMELVIMLKYCFFLIKNEYYFVSNPSNYTVKSNFLFRHRPFAFPGKGGGGWMGGMICIDSPSGNIKFN